MLRYLYVVFSDPDFPRIPETGKERMERMMTKKKAKKKHGRAVWVRFTRDESPWKAGDTKLCSIEEAEKFVGRHKVAEYVGRAPGGEKKDDESG